MKPKTVLADRLFVAAFAASPVLDWRSPEEGAPTQSLNWRASAAGYPWVNSNCGSARSSWRLNSASVIKCGSQMDSERDFSGGPKSAALPELQKPHATINRIL